MPNSDLNVLIGLSECTILIGWKVCINTVQCTGSSSQFNHRSILMQSTEKNNKKKTWRLPWSLFLTYELPFQLKMLPCCLCVQSTARQLTVFWSRAQSGIRPWDKNIPQKLAFLDVIISELQKGLCFQRSRDQQMSHSLWHADTEGREIITAKRWQQNARHHWRQSSFLIIPHFHISNHDFFSLWFFSFLLCK